MILYGFFFFQKNSKQKTFFNDFLKKIYRKTLPKALNGNDKYTFLSKVDEQ